MFSKINNRVISNDSTPYDDAYERRDARLIWKITDRDIPARWEKSQQIYQDLGIPAQFVTYEGIGHEISTEILNDLVAFFKSHTNH